MHTTVRHYLKALPDPEPPLPWGKPTYLSICFVTDDIKHLMHSSNFYRTHRITHHPEDLCRRIVSTHVTLNKEQHTTLRNTLPYNYEHLNKWPSLSAGLHTESLLAKWNTGEELSHILSQFTIPPSAGAGIICLSEHLKKIKGKKSLHNFLFVILGLSAQNKRAVTSQVLKALSKISYSKLPVKAKRCKWKTSGA